MFETVRIMLGIAYTALAVVATIAILTGLYDYWLIKDEEKDHDHT